MDTNSGNFDMVVTAMAHDYLDRFEEKGAVATLSTGDGEIYVNMEVVIAATMWMVGNLNSNFDNSNPVSVGGKSVADVIINVMQVAKLRETNYEEVPDFFRELDEDDES